MEDAYAGPIPAGVVERRSLFSYPDTVRRLEEALAARGVPVFARVDHAANAEAAGLSMRPALVIIFGNALAGTPLMTERPGLALDLPLRILVCQDASGVWISYHDPVAMVGAFGLAAEAAEPLRVVAALAAEAGGR